MQIYPNQFSNHLQNQPLSRFYMLFGEEPLQKLEAIDAIRAKARMDGAEERVNFSADSQFKWHELFEEFQALSLFSSKKLIELEITSAKPGKDGGAMLQEIVALDNPDIFLVIHGGKLEQAQQKSKWFKTLDNLGVYVPCYPVDGQNLTRWVQQRLQSAELQLTADAINILVESCEGNLLAASQEIEKLGLIFPQQTIDVVQVQQSIVNQSRFNVFQLVEHLLLGDIDKAINVLDRLESEGTEATMILWAIQREVFTLIDLHTETSNGNNLATLWGKYRIWRSRQNGYQNALSRLSTQQLEQMIGELSELDLQLKSSQQIKPFVKLAHICVMFSHFEQIKAFKIA